jgi:hypothetical protein
MIVQRRTLPQDHLQLQTMLNPQLGSRVRISVTDSCGQQLRAQMVHAFELNGHTQLLKGLQKRSRSRHHAGKVWLSA